MSGSTPTLDTSDLVYKREKPLFIIHAVLATIFWLLIIVGTLGVALIYLLFFYVFYLFAHSALISWIKGNGVKLGPNQFPDLYRRYQYCCDRLGVTPHPDAYILNGGGILNAFATRFLGRNFVVLYSDVIDAMADNPEAINFYMGHELAHIERKHLKWGPFVAPVSILPLIGAAYSRAREYTCDQFGRVCCASPNDAVQGLAALAAGQKRWADLSLPAYLEQMSETKGFWMSFHEFVADYPWLVKRAARIMDPDVVPPSRSFFAGFLALFVPRLGVGGGAGGIIVVIAIIGILAAIALPAYQQYMMRAQLSQFGQSEEMFSGLDASSDEEAAGGLGQVTAPSGDAAHVAEAAAFGAGVADLVGGYYRAGQTFPANLAEVGVASGFPNSVSAVSIDSNSGVLTITLAPESLSGQKLAFIPTVDGSGSVAWECASDDIDLDLLPLECQP